MKKTLITLLFLVIGVTAYSQEAVKTKDDQKKASRAMELMSKKIDINIDSNLFTPVATNTYVSESPKSVVMAMYVPESYEMAKKKMDNNSTDKFKITSKGEKEINGVKVLYMFGTSEAEGVTLDNEIYCLKVDDETCMMFMGMIEKGADKKYAEAIHKAMNSVIKK